MVLYIGTLTGKTREMADMMERRKVDIGGYCVC